MEQNNYDWISFDWFTFSKLNTFEWSNPLFLKLIPFIPLVFLIRWFLRKLGRQKLKITLTKNLLKKDPRNLIRFLPDLVISVALVFLFIALARPQLSDQQVDQWSEGIDIILLLDISESMKLQDFNPNRLEAAKSVAHTFIEGRVNDRIGIGIFSGDAISYSPLTSDYELLQNLISEIDFNMIDKPGTAIGNALAVGVNRMKESISKSKVIILLSDGENTAGTIDPVTSAKLAAAFGIRMYTIGVGKEGKIPAGQDFFGRTIYYENTLDETTLKEIASIGSGKFFRATNEKALFDIFESINRLEKSEIKESRFNDTQDYYHVYLYWALILLSIWFFLKTTFMNNLLED